MVRRRLGETELEVPPLGLGCGALGDERMSERDASALVGRALERGIFLFDTARSYGASEERLGRALGGRRDDAVIVTKGGYGVDGAGDWSPEAIRLGIEGALRRLRTDRLDVFLLHSCPMHTLVRDDLLGELDRAKERGMIRLRGYSGENEELAWAVRSGRFDVVECSVSLFDRASLDGAVAEAAARGLGVLAKRPLGNAPWRWTSEPEAHDVKIAWHRARAMNLDPSPLPWAEAALRFSAFAPGVACALIGTGSAAHLDEAAEAVARGPLDDERLRDLRDTWNMHASPEWRGII